MSKTSKEDLAPIMDAFISSDCAFCQETGRPVTQTVYFDIQKTDGRVSRNIPIHVCFRCTLPAINGLQPDRESYPFDISVLCGVGSYAGRRPVTPVAESLFILAKIVSDKKRRKG